MGKILILNGSPRAPKTNSKQYAEIFSSLCKEKTVYLPLTKKNHGEICQNLEGVSDLLLVFPLYADGVPVTLLSFLNTLEQNPPQERPTVSVMVNCGFLEPRQNNVAVEIIRTFCQQNGLPFGSVLKIASGEAILSTPFRFLVRSSIRKFASAIVSHKPRTLSVTMPLPKKMFIRASTLFWENYGKRNGLTKESRWKRWKSKAKQTWENVPRETFCKGRENSCRKQAINAICKRAQCKIVDQS